VLIYENSWAAPFATALRRSGGQLVASGRIPVQAILAARRAHVPIVLHEPNAVPGLANRSLARWDTCVAIAFEDARGRIPGGARIETIGYPVRKSILDVPAHRSALAEEARTVLGLEPERRTVMVTGGSQGALHLDQVVAAGVNSWNNSMSIALSSGTASKRGSTFCNSSSL
jgi:UDP-N-acetylglucosamine:LPS N-acetylglucosamine transferase